MKQLWRHPRATDSNKILKTAQTSQRNGYKVLKEEDMNTENILNKKEKTNRTEKQNIYREARKSYRKQKWTI